MFLCFLHGAQIYCACSARIEEIWLEDTDVTPLQVQAPKNENVTTKSSLTTEKENRKKVSSLSCTSIYTIWHHFLLNSLSFFSVLHLRATIQSSKTHIYFIDKTFKIPQAGAVIAGQILVPIKSRHFGSIIILTFEKLSLSSSLLIQHRMLQELLLSTELIFYSINLKSVIFSYWLVCWHNQIVFWPLSFFLKYNWRKALLWSSSGSLCMLCGSLSGWKKSWYVWRLECHTM